MSHNSFQSHFTNNQNTVPAQSNLTSNSSQYYQSNLTPTKPNRNFEFHKSTAHASPVNPNFLNVNYRYNQVKPTTILTSRNADISKSSDKTTMKSMIFESNYKQSCSPIFAQKKNTNGLFKLSDMARTASRHFEDSDFQNNKIPKSLFHRKQSQEKKLLNPKYGNTLAPYFSSSKNINEKEEAVTSLKVFNHDESKINLRKSFIDSKSDNNLSNEIRKTAGLQFILKFKREKQEKKLKEQSKLSNKEEKTCQVPNGQINGSKNLLNLPQNQIHRSYYQDQAFDSSPNDKFYHHSSAAININWKLQSGIQSSKQFVEGSNQNVVQSHQYTFQNIKNKFFLTQSYESSSCNNAKRLNNEKTNLFVPHKKFSIETDFVNRRISPYPKDNFVKNQVKDLTSQQGEKTAVKDKFLSPAFLKNRFNKLSSDSKTAQTIPSPSSFKSAKRLQDFTLTINKLTFVENVDNQSKPYTNQTLTAQIFKEWYLNDFQIGDKLGKGAFGDVYIAREKHLGFICVLKKMSKKRIKQQQRQQHVIRQLKIQMFLNHKHLTSMYGYFHDDDYIYLILEYLPDGSLSQIKKRKKTSEKQTSGIIKQVCEGLRFMHQENIIHRDIKPENIFVNQGYVKLGDFGCSVFTDNMRKTLVSCLEYSSPEQLNGECYNEKIDMWGIGVLAYELLTGRSPFQKQIINMNHEQFDFSVLKFPGDVNLSQDAKDFIHSLLNIDPVERLDIQEALEHKFITSNLTSSSSISFE